MTLLWRAWRHQPFKALAYLIENKRKFLDVSADIMEYVDAIFFGDQ